MNCGLAARVPVFIVPRTECSGVAHDIRRLLCWQRMWPKMAVLGAGGSCSLKDALLCEKKEGQVD